MAELIKDRSPSEMHTQQMPPKIENFNSNICRMHTLAQCAQDAPPELAAFVGSAGDFLFSVPGQVIQDAIFGPHYTRISTCGPARAYLVEMPAKIAALGMGMGMGI